MQRCELLEVRLRRGEGEMTHAFIQGAIYMLEAIVGVLLGVLTVYCFVAGTSVWP